MNGGESGAGCTQRGILVGRGGRKRLAMDGLPIFERRTALRTLALAAALMLPAGVGGPALADDSADFSSSFADINAPVSGTVPAAGAVDVTAIDTVDEPSARGQGIGGGVASYYADKFNGRRTASGEAFSNRAMTAAHRTLPFGTMLQVTNPANGNTVVVRVNDRGPFHGGRLIDLSKAAASQLGLVARGHGRVELAVLR